MLLNTQMSLHNLMYHREMFESKVCDKAVCVFRRPQNYSPVLIDQMKMPYRSSLTFEPKDTLVFKFLFKNISEHLFKIFGQ